MADNFNDANLAANTSLMTIENGIKLDLLINMLEEKQYVDKNQFDAKFKEELKYKTTERIAKLFDTTEKEFINELIKKAKEQ